MRGVSLDSLWLRFGMKGWLGRGFRFRPHGFSGLVGMQVRNGFIRGELGSQGSLWWVGLRAHFWLVLVRDVIDITRYRLVLGRRVGHGG